MKNVKYIVFIVVLVAVSFVLFRSEDSVPVIEPDSAVEQVNDENTDDVLPVQEALTISTCENAGGTWNACGSACRMNPGDVCIELCVEYCECTSDQQCPSGFVCGDIIEGVGVCL